MMTLTWITTLVIAYCLGKWQANKKNEAALAIAIAETQQRWMRITNSAYKAGTKEVKGANK